MNKNNEKITVKHVQYAKDGSIAAIEFSKTTTKKFEGDKCNYDNVIRFIEDREERRNKRK